ncbi:hypothetical protein BDZ94DRAFT_1257328 [Collybia nuda]|uniref:Uncharacterized protein n=1 Tax=Collybia nuda TaxID=64659 RepID=A0A9P6CJ57_9AGAR|nr:hypothetical protein BDZ94DRAFT_1257328 [Collybia nuda]
MLRAGENLSHTLPHASLKSCSTAISYLPILHTLNLALYIITSLNAYLYHHVHMYYTGKK